MATLSASSRYEGHTKSKQYQTQCALKSFIHNIHITTAHKNVTFIWFLLDQPSGRSFPILLLRNNEIIRYVQVKRGIQYSTLNQTILL